MVHLAIHRRLPTGTWPNHDMCPERLARLFPPTSGANANGLATVRPPRPQDARPSGRVVLFCEGWRVLRRLRLFASRAPAPTAVRVFGPPVSRSRQSSEGR